MTNVKSSQPSSKRCCMHLFLLCPLTINRPEKFETSATSIHVPGSPGPVAAPFFFFFLQIIRLDKTVFSLSFSHVARAARTPFELASLSRVFLTRGWKMMGRWRLWEQAHGIDGRSYRTNCNPLAAFSIRLARARFFSGARPSLFMFMCMCVLGGCV